MSNIKSLIILDTLTEWENTTFNMKCGVYLVEYGEDNSAFTLIRNNDEVKIVCFIENDIDLCDVTDEVKAALLKELEGDDNNEN